ATSDSRLILLLDDFHLITNNQIQEAVRFWLEHMPPQMHLVITSRIDPPFSLARWRVRQEVTEIRAADLRFSRGDTALFCNQTSQLNLTHSDITALETRTEGWIAGLQLAALSLSRQNPDERSKFIAAFTGSDRYLMDYLIDEILQQQPEHIRHFLLNTAILQQFNAALCTAVLATDIHTTTAILAELEHANLFLMPLDNQRQWFRYHRLFADFLLHRLQYESPDLMAQNHHRASLWYEQADRLDDAIYHALKSTDMERAASLMTVDAESKLVRGEISGILRQFEKLPVHLQERYPLLRLYHAWAVMFTGNLAGVDSLISQIESATDKLDDHLSAYLLVLRSYLATRNGRFHEGIHRSNEALQQLSTLSHNKTVGIMHGALIINLADSYSYIGDYETAVTTYQQAMQVNQKSDNVLAALGAARVLGDLYSDQGDLHRAKATYEQGLQMARQWTRQQTGKDSRLLAAAQLQFGLGMVYYHWNELTQAETYLQEATELYELGGLANLAEGIHAIAKLKLAQHDSHAYQSWMMRLKALEIRYQAGYMSQRIEAAIVDLQLCEWQAEQQAERPLANIERWLQTTPPHPNEALNLANEPIYLVKARALIVLNRYEAARSLLTNLTETTRTQKRWGTLLEQLVLFALALDKLGETAVAQQQLSEALSLAEPQNNLRIFLDEGVPMIKLLRGEGKRPFVTKLLHAFHKPSLQPEPSTLPSDPLLEPLSERELEVLTLIATGASNQEIANQLVIAKSTAKKHVSNIIGKLGTSNRTQAVTRARELHLI
ncbi:MAG: tetratricopeptide repeat protein, partial [Chloroflexi bacterium]|nr:tetratricopeptide repeat protein [Chloroflexota bacterium]